MSVRRALSGLGSRLRVATTLATALRATTSLAVAGAAPACYHHCEPGSSNVQIATVRKPAPAWKNEAVVGGAFKTLSNKARGPVERTLLAS